MNAQVLDFATTSTRADEAVFAGTFVQVLGMLLAGHRTGLLVVARPPQTCKVRFVDGQIVSASSGSPSKLLGEILVHCGFLPPSDVSDALCQANAERRRLGAVVVERGLLSREQVEEGLRLQVRDLLFNALYWPSGSWRFEPDEGVSEPREEVTLRLSTAELILQLVACIESAEAVRHALGDLDCPIASVRDSVLGLAGASLSSADAYVLSRVDGNLSPREIVNISPLPAPDVEKSLLGLLCAGFVAWKPKPLARGRREGLALQHQSDAGRDLERELAALPLRNHFEVLGLRPSASMGDIKEAYERLVKEFHPDAPQNGSSVHVAAAVKTIFLRVGEAYQVLGSPESRACYEARLGLSPVRMPVPAQEPEGSSKPTTVPEEALAEAERLLTEGRRFEAATTLEDLIPTLGARLRQRARLLLARAHAGTPSGRRLAEAELREILDQEPDCTEALLLLGTLYRDLGMNRRAAGAFSKALEILPGHREAARQLRTLTLGADDTRPLIFARSA